MANNVDLFARPPRTSISPFELNREGKGQALVLRYAGCNLRCPLCYAWRYAWSIQNGYEYKVQQAIAALDALPSVVQNKIIWIRIQGGEPCLNYNRTLNTITFAARALKITHQHGLNYYDHTRAVIQTNGIMFSNLDTNQIDNIREHLFNEASKLSEGRIIFEVSFKSPHSNNNLAGSNVFNKQLQGFYILLDQIFKPLWEYGLDNIAVYPVAGLGPSIDSHNVWIIPIDSAFLPEEIPLFHPSTWSEDFKKLYNRFTQNIVPTYDTYKDFQNNPRTNSGKKIAIEEFEPTRFQTSWISGYAGRYKQSKANVPDISIILRKTSNNPNSQWIRLCYMKNKVIERVLYQIPTSNNPTKLLELVQDMNRVFYPSHPIGHYPYL